MKFSSKLYAQHLGWTFKKHWQIQGKRTANDTGASKELQKHGIQITEADVAVRKLKKFQLDILDYHPVIVPKDDLNLHRKKQLCHVYGDENVLLEGVCQAQVLTKTIQINGFPKTVEDFITKMALHNNIDRRIHKIIIESHALDAEQIKFPKGKLLDRPAFNLPREYGASHYRRNRQLINRLISECEKLSGKSTHARRCLFDDVSFKVTVAKGDDILQLEVLAEKFLTSFCPIEHVQFKCEGDLPDLYPLRSTISLPKKSIYTTETFYPLSQRIDCTHPHTFITYFNKEFVGNLHDVSVTTKQFQSRTMIKAFAVAAARAKQLYGEATDGNLPKPIVVQGIHTNGQTFHFGIFQLNTLNLDDACNSKNYWFHKSNIDLFAEGGYNRGRPYLQGYNKNVFRCLNAFYNNA